MRIQPIIARSLLGLLGATLFASPVAAQVFDSGPSDPALFDNVINLPNISFEESLGGDGLTTQLNVSGNRSVGRFFSANSGTEVNVSGGEVQSFFSANSGSEVNVSGGEVALHFDANSGSLVNISGGTVGAGTGGFDANSGSVVNISGGNAGNNFEAHPGSEVNISGGSVGGSARFLPGSDVELFGGEFNLNGAPFTGSTITLSEGDVFNRYNANRSEHGIAHPPFGAANGPDANSSRRRPVRQF